MMLFYQITITALLLIPFAVALRNFFSFAAIRRDDAPRNFPRVSVLVPARNEERSIERCVRSLLAQEYPAMEVIVLNDDSDDATGNILATIARADLRLKIIDGAPLPAGWIGKNWACHQLSNIADGRWLFFTDADTHHAPQSVRAAVALAERSRLALLSGVPLQRMESFWERTIIPMTQFLYVAWLPNRWITERRNPKFSAANGQLLMIRRDAYDAIGGHAACRENLVEDIRLGRMAKERGFRTALATAVETAECRMYRSFGEIVEGFSKNLFPGFGYSFAALAMFIISSLLLYTAPIFFLIVGIITGRISLALTWLPLAQLAIAGAIRGMIAIRFRMGADQIFHQPLSAAMAALIGINSARLSRSKRGTTWKGRAYGESGGATEESRIK
ncbi:MAG: glycosyltransferase family 2 protein [Bacteroidota bacterium]